MALPQAVKHSECLVRTGTVMPNSLKGFIVFSLVMLMTGFVHAGDKKEFTLGVLAFRPKPETQVRWQPLADYLTSKLDGMKVRLKVFTYTELEKELNEKRLDFVLTNPGHYIQIKHHHNLSGALATLVDFEGNIATEFFGGTIITRKDRGDILELRDLKGKTIAIVSRGSLGGYQAQALELLHAGIKLPQDARVIETEMPHDRVLDAVLKGEADAGFVRTGIIETMAREGRLDISSIKVLSRRDVPGYPHALSTSLYPEWPIIALPHVDEDIARQVVAALLSISHDGELAKKCRIHGFTIPADYAPVENLLRELRFPPFDRPPQVTAHDIWQQYRYAILLLLLAVSIIGILSFWFIINFLSFAFKLKALG
jgi:ABC-type phosphate/phosphonate transport system substrate-binding protein